jgi:uncharacterized protein YndB with AHSA1/START domain
MKTASGRVSGNDLILIRTFKAPIDDVWASLTDAERTARWFGPWEGEAGPGKIIRVQMVYEQDAPWTSARIDRCEAPWHLALTTLGEPGGWQLEVTLEQKGDTTELRFVHHLSNPALARDAGPGWEYYLDMLVAARAGEKLPSFDAYYPAMQSHYTVG